MADQFKNIDVPCRFLDAIRPDLSFGWPKIYQRKKRLARYGYDLTQGEMGCYLSHRQAWREFIDSDNAFCCVLEDDVELQPLFTEGLIALCKHAEKWGMVRLYGIYPREYENIFEFMPGRWLIDYFYQPSGLQGYVLDRITAQRLLAFTQEMFCAIDDMADRDWEHKLRIYGVEPCLVRESHQFVSSIGNRKRPKMSVMKKLAREIQRSGSNLAKRCWVVAKKSRYLIKNVVNSRVRP